MGTDKAHPGGANHLMADGHAEGLNFVYTVASSNYPTIWNATATNPIKKIYYNH